MPRTFLVEHARSSRSTCKGCNVKIDKNILRMGIFVEAADDYPPSKKWYHLS